MGFGIPPLHLHHLLTPRTPTMPECRFNKCITPHRSRNPAFVGRGHCACQTPGPLYLVAADGGP